MTGKAHSRKAFTVQFHNMYAYITINNILYSNVFSVSTDKQTSTYSISHTFFSEFPMSKEITKRKIN